MLHAPIAIAAVIAACLVVAVLGVIAVWALERRPSLDADHLVALKKAISEERRKMDRSTDAWTTALRDTPMMGNHFGGEVVNPHVVVPPPESRPYFDEINRTLARDPVADGFRDWLNGQRDAARKT